MKIYGRRTRERLERKKKRRQAVITIVKCVAGFGLAYVNLVGILLLFG